MKKETKKDLIVVLLVIAFCVGSVYYMTNHYKDTTKYKMIEMIQKER